MTKVRVENRPYRLLVGGTQNDLCRLLEMYVKWNVLGHKEAMKICTKLSLAPPLPSSV